MKNKKKKERTGKRKNEDFWLGNGKEKNRNEISKSSRKALLQSTAVALSHIVGLCFKCYSNA